MEKMFEEFKLGTVKLMNRFVFPPIKLACGNPDGKVTERQLQFYSQIAREDKMFLLQEKKKEAI